MAWLIALEKWSWNGWSGPRGGGGPALRLPVCMYISLYISFSCGVPCIKASSSSYANEVH